MQREVQESSQELKASRVWWALLLFGFLAVVPVRRFVDARQSAPGGDDFLYIPSGETLRRLSLGYQGLLADIYWTRVVQYFGRRHLAGGSRFELLGPLLRITTTLDPHLLIAYRFGAIFLAEKPPGGAGQPQEALALLRRGIVANPDYWRFWQDLGFIYYWDLHDYPGAARSFQTGSQIPGADLWMKTLAASVAAQGGELQTSRLLWSQMYHDAETESIRRSALEHLAALQAKEDMSKLDQALGEYERKGNRRAKSFGELVAAGLIGSEPVDPSGCAYVIDASGHAALGPGSRIDLRLLPW